GKSGFIDKSGSVVIPFIYDNAYNFSEDWAAVQKDGSYGFIDHSGKVVLPFIYDDVKHVGFFLGYARVSKDGEEFTIKKSGKRVE
ncbi:MAG: WG repeat-containing protein, partial [Muribaculaceae bacterium]|nr:WG repeat-containing protein [Muribaculaceae bacterium]